MAERRLAERSTLGNTMQTELQFTGYDFERAKVKDLGYQFNDARELPCGTCPLADSCAEKGTECSAFRKWSASGNYEDEDLQKHLRIAK